MTAYADTMSSASRVGRFEAGELFLLFAKIVGGDAKRGYGSLDTKMEYMQFMQALLCVGLRQYPEASDNVTALDSLLCATDRAEHEACAALATSSRRHSLGHLLMLKSKVDARTKKKKVEDALKALEKLEKKKRKELTRIRLAHRRQEEHEHQRRRKAHQDHQRMRQEKMQKEASEKIRRRIEYEAWLRQHSP